jgi:hypothetical protein
MGLPIRTRNYHSLLPTNEQPLPLCHFPIGAWFLEPPVFFVIVCRVVYKANGVTFSVYFPYENTCILVQRCPPPWAYIQHWSCVCAPPHLECSPKSPSACTQIWPSNYFHHGAVEMNMYSGLCCQQQKLGVKRANGKPCFIWSIQQPWIQPIASESTTDVPHWQPVLVIPFCFRSFTGNMKHAQSVSNVLINSPMSQKYSPLWYIYVWLPAPTTGSWTDVIHGSPPPGCSKYEHPAVDWFRLFVINLLQGLVNFCRGCVVMSYMTLM